MTATGPQANGEDEPRRVVQERLGIERQPHRDPDEEHRSPIVHTPTPPIASIAISCIRRVHVGPSITGTRTGG